MTTDKSLEAANAVMADLIFHGRAYGRDAALAEALQQLTGAVGFLAWSEGRGALKAIAALADAVKADPRPLPN